MVRWAMQIFKENEVMSGWIVVNDGTNRDILEITPGTKEDVQGQLKLLGEDIVAGTTRQMGLPRPKSEG